MEWFTLWRICCESPWIVVALQIESVDDSAGDFREQVYTSTSYVIFLTADTSTARVYQS